MFDFTFPADKALLYPALQDAALSLTDGEADPIANMANIAALLWMALPDINWSGFYRLIGGELVLGPFQGKPACIRIAVGKGVCGTAVATGSIQRISDVHAFPGHIACDEASRSEIVLPLAVEGSVFGVLDIDSPRPARFDEADEAGLAELCRSIAPRLR